MRKIIVGVIFGVIILVLGLSLLNKYKSNGLNIELTESVNNEKVTLAGCDKMYAISKGKTTEVSQADFIELCKILQEPLQKLLDLNPDDEFEVDAGDWESNTYSLKIVNSENNKTYYLCSALCGDSILKVEGIDNMPVLDLELNSEDADKFSSIVKKYGVEFADSIDIHNIEY